MRAVNFHVARALAGVALLLIALSASAEEPRLALKGYDPVAYFSAGKPVKGAPDFRADWDGARYQFANAKHRDTFTANPDRYVPQFKGLCAAGMAYGKQVEADPTVWKIVDGKLYVFGGPNRLEMQEKDPGLLDRAHKNWRAAPR